MSMVDLSRLAFRWLRHSRKGGGEKGQILRDPHKSTPKPAPVDVPRLVRDPKRGQIYFSLIC